MKKILSVFGTILAMILIVLICFGAYNYVIDIEDEQNRVQDELTKEIDSNPLFSLENYPKVDASLATQPLTDAFIEDFTGTLPNEEELNYTNTHPGYVKLINGEVDLIVVTEPSDEEIKLAEEAGVDLLLLSRYLNNRMDAGGK